MALYIAEADLMLYHIPKCGGTWVRQALHRWGVNAIQLSEAGVSSQHSAPQHHPWHTGPRLVFLREPTSWYESWWRFQCAHKWPTWEPTRWHPCRGVEDQLDADTFGEWVERVTFCEAPLTTLYGLYVGSIAGGPEPAWCHIEPFEKMDAALQDVLTAAGVKHLWADVGPVNVTQKRSLGRPEAVARAHEAIRRAEHLIYDRFGDLLWGE